MHLLKQEAIEAKQLTTPSLHFFKSCLALVWQSLFRFFICLQQRTVLCHEFLHPTLALFAQLFSLFLQGVQSTLGLTLLGRGAISGFNSSLSRS